ARLARELLADASAGQRRRELIDEAVDLARRSGDRSVLADVLDARMNALWQPGGAGERLVAAEEIIELARATGDHRRERDGLFWRFAALIEIGRVADAESTLAIFEREATIAGDEPAVAMAIARQSVLATLRGHFDEAEK